MSHLFEASSGRFALYLPRKQWGWVAARYADHADEPARLCIGVISEFNLAKVWFHRTALARVRVREGINYRFFAICLIVNRDA